MIKKIFFISPRDMRINRSDAVHMMLTCDSFVQNGVQVELITPTVRRREYKIKFGDIFSLYSLKPNFTITELPTKLKENRQQNTNPILTVLNKFTYFSLYFFKNRKTLNDTNNIIYSKCFISTTPALFLKKLKIIKSPIVFETVVVKNSILHRFVFRNCDKIISHTKFCTEHILKYTGINKSKLFEPPVPTHIESFLKSTTLLKNEYKQKFNFNPSKTSILYAGKISVDLPEVNYFLAAAKMLPSAEFIIVGANSITIKYYSQIKNELSINNLTIISFVPLTEYYQYVKAADILVSYYPSTFHHKYHLSPGKSGVYFASGNPVIFSDLPSLRSLFNEDILFFVDPDEPEKLVKTIKVIIANKAVANEKAQNALTFAEKHSYHFFAKEILGFIQASV